MGSSPGCHYCPCQLCSRRKATASQSGKVVVCPFRLAEADQASRGPWVWEENLLQNIAPSSGPEPPEAGTLPSVSLPDSWACEHLPQMDGRALETCQVFIRDGKCYSWTLWACLKPSVPWSYTCIQASTGEPWLFPPPHSQSRVPFSAWKAGCPSPSRFKLALRTSFPSSLLSAIFNRISIKCWCLAAQWAFLSAYTLPIDSRIPWTLLWFFLKSSCWPGALCTDCPGSGESMGHSAGSPQARL